MVRSRSVDNGGTRAWIQSQLDLWEAQGLQVYRSVKPRKCHLCWKSQSRFRRMCPICERMIAPGCRPVHCWSDDLNHCRECHTLIGTLRHIQFKLQFLPDQPETYTQESHSDVLTYKDLPIGIQLNIMVYVFQAKDFVWSGYHTSLYASLMHGCPHCTYSDDDSEI